MRKTDRKVANDYLTQTFCDNPMKNTCSCDILIKYKYLSGKLIFHMIYGMINEYVCA